MTKGGSKTSDVRASMQLQLKCNESSSEEKIDSVPQRTRKSRIKKETTSSTPRQRKTPVKAIKSKGELPS